MTPRIRQLLSDLSDCRRDLAEASTEDQAACAKANIRSLQHSLWLAGHNPQSEDAQ